MENGINTSKKELYTAAELEDFSKIEVIDEYVLLAMKYEAAMDGIERMQNFLRLANHNAYGTSSEKRIDQDQLATHAQAPDQAHQYGKHTALLVLFFMDSKQQPCLDPE